MSQRLTRLASIGIATLLLGSAAATAQEITFEGQERATPVRVVKKVCFPGLPPCNGPCVWFPADHEVNFKVTSRPSAVLTKVEWTVTDEFGNPVSSGNGAISADGKEAIGTASPAPGAILSTQCQTFQLYHYYVHAEMDYPDDPFGPERSNRHFAVRLVCVPCFGDPPIHPDHNGPHRIFDRAVAQDFHTQWIVLNGTEIEQPALVTFTTSAPWLSVDFTDGFVMVPTGECLSLDIPLIVSAAARAGDKATVSMAVTPILNPDATMVTTTRVAIISAGIGACSPLPGSCFEEHAGGSCSDPECCNAVCGVDPFCCAELG